MQIRNKFFHFLRFESVAFLILLIGVFVGVYKPLWEHIRQTPTGTLYTFAEGYLPDYYQYLSWVKDGMMGNVFLSSRYTEKVYPAALVHTVFPFIGFLGNIFGLPSYAAYTLARIISNLIFLFALVYLIKNFLPSAIERGLAYLFLLATTGVWSLDSTSGKLIEAIPWSGNFNIVGKFFLPPHHLLSLTILIIAIVKLTKVKTSKELFLAVIIGAIGGFLNPSLLTFFFLFLFSTLLLLFMFHLIPKLLSINRLIYSNNSRGLLGPSLCFISVGGLILLYNAYLFQNILPWSRMYTLMRGFNPPVAFSAYLMALGPTLVPAAIGILDPKVRNTRLGMFLMIWAFFPLLLFPFLGNPLPFNASRLFQSYQYIPLSVLGAAGLAYVSQLLSRLKIPPHFSLTVIILGFSLYGITPYVKGIEGIVEPIKPWHINAYIPNSAMRTFEILDNKTPPESVVLASETVSTMIPAFTHNRVLLGRDDVAPDYYEKREKAFAMLDGRFTQEEAKQFLKDYNVSYILFGLDAHQFFDTKNTVFPFLKIFYQDEAIIVVKVTKD